MSGSQGKGSGLKILFLMTSPSQGFFPLVQTEGPEHISSGIPEVFRHSLKPDRIFVMLERLNSLADDSGS